VLLKLIGHRNLHRAIERQLAVMDPPQHFHRRLHHVVAFQDLVSEAGAGQLDLLGQRDFLLPGQQRNLAHLRQIHPHRIIGPRFVVLDHGEQIVGVDLQLRIVLFFFVQNRTIQIVVNLQRLDGNPPPDSSVSFCPRDRFVFQAV